MDQATVTPRQDSNRQGSNRQGSRRQGNARQTYVNFEITAETPALLSTVYAKEVVDVPFSQVTALPNMPAPVLGLLNRRSRVIWLVDLAQLLGLPPLMPTTEVYRVIVLSVHGEDSQASASLSSDLPLSLMAIAVPTIRGSVRILPEAIQPPSEHLSPLLLPYLDGCLSIKPPQPELRNEFTLVLNANRIATSPLLIQA